MKIEPGRPAAPGKQPGVFVFKALVFGGAGTLGLLAVVAPAVLEAADAVWLALLALLGFGLSLGVRPR